MSALQALRNPSISLPAYGWVQDQDTQEPIPYDPSRIARSLHHIVLSYFSNPPRDAEGRTRFMTLLSGRQVGKSLAVAYCGYIRTAFTPHTDAVTIADLDERAAYLHSRVHFLHQHWPEALRSPTVSTREKLQLTFDPRVGGSMRTLSAEGTNVGVGQSPDVFHASECALWKDFAGTMGLVLPSLMNRRNALVVYETTPYTGGTAFYDHWCAAKRGVGRDFAVFVPFWDGVLNTRAWGPHDVLSVQEQRLLDRYCDGDEVNGKGLTLRNLAFRRQQLDTVAMRRDPRLFDVWYPSDDVTCWLTSQNAVFTDHILARQLDRVHEMDEWAPTATFMQMEEYNPSYKYVIGVDPCGFAARDHAAVQVIRVGGGKMVQAATFADHVDPVKLEEVVLTIAAAYGNPLVVVESTGVGQALLSALVKHGYPRTYYERPGIPGIAATGPSVTKATRALVDELLDSLDINDRDTLKQLRGYKGDKDVEEGVRTETLRGEPSATSRRRQRHHWDKVSALIWAVYIARHLPRGKAPIADAVIDVAPAQRGMTVKEWEDYRKGAYVTRRRAPGFDRKLRRK
jgi:hypothetical protein